MIIIIICKIFIHIDINIYHYAILFTMLNVEGGGPYTIVLDEMIFWHKAYFIQK